jgi:hypothetical protein
MKCILNSMNAALLQVVDVVLRYRLRVGLLAYPCADLVEWRRTAEGISSLPQLFGCANGDEHVSLNFLPAVDISLEDLPEHLLSELKCLGGQTPWQLEHNIRQSQVYNWMLYHQVGWFEWIALGADVQTAPELAAHGATRIASVLRITVADASRLLRDMKVLAYRNFADIQEAAARAAEFRMSWQKLKAAHLDVSSSQPCVR